MRDPDNPENSAAGNLSDWLKHTIWLSGLGALRAADEQRADTPPPRQLHSCHAGRGMYHIPPDSRRAALQRLWQPAPQPLLLQRAQRAIGNALGVNQATVEWYAGSALLCQWWRQQQRPHQGTHTLYEWHPETRAVLSATLAQLYPALAERTQVAFQDTHGRGRFDGETHIAEALPSWPAGSVLLLDPFALWRHPKHAERRQRFLRIFEALRDRGGDAPAVSVFFAWGSGTPETELGAAANRSPHYRQLRQLARESAHALLEMHWQWDLHCSMWWLLPQRDPKAARQVAREVAAHVDRLLERFAAPRSSTPPSDEPTLLPTAHLQPARWRWSLASD